VRTGDVYEALAKAKLLTYDQATNFMRLVEAGASLDAAMTLVPDFGNHWPQIVYKSVNPNNPARQKHRVSLWQLLGAPTEIKGHAATSPLALCAAALRARATTPNPEDHPQGGNHG
jgi:hypothetical protein